LAIYQIPTTTVSQPLSAWRQTVERELPHYRNDIRDGRNHPMNVVLAGEPDCLLGQLQSRGWRAAEMLDWGNLLRLLSPRTSTTKLPVLPQVHAGKHEAAVLRKDLADDSRLLLRLWSTDIKLDPGDIPVFVGNVSQQRSDSLMNLLVIPHTENDFKAPFRQLRKDIAVLPERSAAVEGQRLLIDLTGDGSCRGKKSITSSGHIKPG
jgi:hypothetical protein